MIGGVSGAAVRRRRLGRPDLFLMVVNTVVGAGIVALPGRAFALSGPHAIEALAIAALAAMAIALAFARLAIRFQGAGGPYLYAVRTLGPSAGFATLLLLVPTRLLATAVSLNILVETLGIAAAGPGRSLAIVGIALAMTALALTGVYLPIRLSNLMGAMKIMLLASLAVLGVGALAVGVPIQSQPAGPGPPAIGAAVLIWFYALSGFESPTILAAEGRNPSRDLPVALVGGLLVAGLLYAALLVTCLAFTPSLSSSPDPLLHLDGVVPVRFAPFLALALAALVVATLPSQFTVAPRLLASAVPVDGPSWLVPGPGGASVGAILLCSTIIVALSAGNVATLVISAGITRLASYAICSLGLLRVSWHAASGGRDRAIGLSALVACLAIAGLALV